VAQVSELDQMLADRSEHLDAVVELVADTDEVVRRLLARGQEQGRSDDSEDVIRRRLEVFGEQTAPLAKVYADKGLLRRINGLGPVDEVTARLLAALPAG
jgi:adenylate kinase